MSEPASGPVLVRLAHALLGKAGRSQGGRAVVLNLDAATLPELHAARTPDDLVHVELLLQSLAQTGWVALRTNKQRSFQSLADLAPALILRDAESLTVWSGYRPEEPKWSRELVRLLGAPDALNVPDLPALLDYLRRNPLPWFEDLDHAECAGTLNRLADTCRSGAQSYVREMSAHHFSGHSKVLDSRVELLRLLGAREGQFLEAPVQLLVSLPSGAIRRSEGAAIVEVLFVENLVSFERMANDRQADWECAALVYSAGFKSAARRLRTTQGSTIYWRNQESQTDAAAFSAWLYARDGSAQVTPRVNFYGDLDFAGMQILAMLRQGFPNCQAWQPGYGALVSLLTAGNGHSAASAAKEGQIDPGLTGCEYADAVLVPALRRVGKCVDQEAWPLPPLSPSGVGDCR